jgi:hypothetical protein
MASRNNRDLQQWLPLLSCAICYILKCKIRLRDFAAHTDKARSGVRAGNYKMLPVWLAGQALSGEKIFFTKSLIIN